MAVRSAHRPASARLRRGAAAGSSRTCRVSPRTSTRSNLEAGFYIHAMVKVLPRIRQFVKQLNATLVKVYDPFLELDFENPVPEDVEAKLKTASAGVDKWWTKDEVRAQYGDAPLPDRLGEQIVVAGKGAVSLESVLNPEEAPVADPADKPPKPEADDPEDDGDDSKDKSLTGVKKKT